MNRKIICGFSNLELKQKQDLLFALKADFDRDITLRSLHETFISKTVSQNVKESILNILLHVKNKKSTGIFLKVFEEKRKNPHLFPFSIWFLSTVTSEKSLELMIETLKSSPDRQKRADAAYILRAYRGSEQAITVLIEVLNNKSQSSEVRAQAAESLGCIADSSITKTLAQNLGDSSKEVQFWCIYALWQVSMDTSVIPKLESFIGDNRVVDDTWVMEDEAKEAIKFIKARGKILGKYEDKSGVTIWDIHSEVLEEVEKVKKEEELQGLDLKP